MFPDAARLHLVQTHVESSTGVRAARQSVETVALASVVTQGVLEEFELMRFSFELFHGVGHHWFLRCCEQTAARFANDEFVHCTVFESPGPDRKGAETKIFNRIVEQKMNAMEDAWSAGGYEAVLLLDADLLITRPFVSALDTVSGDVVLTPHHWHTTRMPDMAKYGFFNSGFVYSRNPKFSRWWRHTFRARPELYTDQQCLDDVLQHFPVGLLGEDMNVGFWRCEAGESTIHEYRIPKDCSSVHVHFFQPRESAQKLVSRTFGHRYISFTSGQHSEYQMFDYYQMLHKTFALTVLQFLRGSSEPKHQVLYREILDRDHLQLYAAIFGV